jgi:hypothetical protein
MISAMSLDRTTRFIVVVAATYWWAVFLAMHVLQPEFSPLRDPGSAYVVGAYGTSMTTTYFALCAALLSAAIGLRMRLAARSLPWIGSALFLLAAIGAVIAGIYPMDFPPPARTFSGRLHVLGGMLTFPSWVLGTLVFSVSFRGNQRSGSHSGALMALSASIVGAFVAMLLSIRLLGFAGYAQRALLALLFAWTIVAMYSDRATRHLFADTSDEKEHPPIRNLNGRLKNVEGRRWGGWR